MTDSELLGWLCSLLVSHDLRVIPKDDGWHVSVYRARWGTVVYESRQTVRQALEAAAQGQSI